MKKYIKQNPACRIIYSVILLVLVISGCDKNFEEMNKNPNAYNDPVISNLFSFSIVSNAGVGNDRDHGNGMYAGGIVQYFSTLGQHITGEKYLYDQGYNDVFFEVGYKNHLKEIEHLISLVKDKPEQSNTYAMARIMRVYAFHRITDFYGDIPYTEAGKGYSNSLFKPKYDKQSDIYADMLNELDKSASLLDPSKTTIGNADLIYSGNVNKWKKFAYSLMLRLGMRLTKVSPTMAETYVKKAITGGVMQNNSDIAKLDHTSGTGLNWNWDSWYQINEELRKDAKGKGLSKLSATFVGFLKDNNDPRLPFYATLWNGNVDPALLSVSSDPNLQKGLPNGYDNTSIRNLIPGWTDAMYLGYSEINLNTIASLVAPSIFQSYAEVELLLSEAALRGWTGDAELHYNNGVRAAMEMTSIFPGNFTISPSAISTYLTNNSISTGTFDQKLEKIANQYWVVHFFVDNIESFSNWRRTGYPKLTPTNYPGNRTGGVIPRRLVYPQSERVLNTSNYNAAVQIQGADLYTTRVWWDK